MSNFQPNCTVTAMAFGDSFRAMINSYVKDNPNDGIEIIARTKDIYHGKVTLDQGEWAMTVLPSNLIIPDNDIQTIDTMSFQGKNPTQITYGTISVNDIEWAAQDSFQPNCQVIDHDGKTLYGQVDMTREEFQRFPALHILEVRYKTQDVLHILRTKGKAVVVEPFDFDNLPDEITINSAKSGLEWIDQDDKLIEEFHRQADEVSDILFGRKPRPKSNMYWNPSNTD